MIYGLALLGLVVLVFVVRRIMAESPSATARSAVERAREGTDDWLAADDADDGVAGSPYEKYFTGAKASSAPSASLSDLAGGIAHEINNPIAIMVEEAGWIEDLLDEDDSRTGVNMDEMRRAVREIGKQGRRCKEITQNLLSFARRTSGKVEDVQINALVMEAVNASQKKAQSRSVTIETKLADSLPNTRLSPTEMQQILVNLINNAIDAMEAKGGTIGITTAMAGGQLGIDVADTGHGVPSDQLERIFTPFFTTKPVGKGTGLGLSICQGLIANMGGRLGVNSEVGKGTTFHIRLPVVQTQGRAELPYAAPADSPAGSGEGARGRAPARPTVILVVLDEAPFVEALRRRLAKRRIEVLGAYSGEEGLSLLGSAENVDVVLLDVNMPGTGGGTALLLEMKKVRPLVEVILLSAHATVEAAIEGMKLGAFDYLLTPCDFSQLLDQVGRARAEKDRQERKIRKARIKEITLRRV